VRRAILVVGPPGSGKSTLIRSLFPGIPPPSQLGPLQVYEVAEGLCVAEARAPSDAVLLAGPGWRLEACVVLIDGGSAQADLRALALAAAAPRRALVLSKADVATDRARGEARALASRFRLELFEVSALRGTGVGELRSWLLGAPRAEPRAAPGLAVDLVPLPQPEPPSAEGLSEVERRILALCDGRRSLLELAEALGIPYGEARRAVDRLYAMGYLGGFSVKVRA